MTNPIHEKIPNPIEIMLNLLAESEEFFARTISPAAYAELTWAIKNSSNILQNVLNVWVVDYNPTPLSTDV